MNLPNLITLLPTVLAIVSTPLAADAPTNMLWFDQPASSFHSSFPLGNGRIGAMVFGGVDEERIVLNESSVWSGSREENNRPGAHQNLAEIRRLLLAGKNMEAEALVNQTFTCQGKGSAFARAANAPFGCYQVLGNLRFRFSADAAPQCVSGHRAHQEVQEVAAATDADPITKWCVEHNNQPVQWLMDAGKLVQPERYAFTSAEDVPARDPRTWKFEGSSDGKEWTLLDEHRDEATSAKRHERREYAVSKPGSFRIFRFTFQPNPGTQHFQVSEIEIGGLAKAPVGDYRRELNLATAAARVGYTRDGVNYQREYFVSAPDDVFVSHFTASKPGGLTFNVGLDRPERFETRAVSANELLITGTLNDGLGGKGVTYAARLRVIATGGNVRAEGNKLAVTGADEVLVLLAAATDYRGFAGRNLSDPLAATQMDLDKSARKTFSQLREAQSADHAKWYGRVMLNLPATPNSALPTDRRLVGFNEGAPDPALAALYFNFGRYLLISSSRPGGLPPNLQGIWAEEIQTPWNGDWHLDINVQMNYWPAEICNLSELHEPLHKLIASLVEPGRKTAQAYYDSPGWVAHVFTTPWGYTAPGESASWGATVCGSAWLGGHLWEHYAFNGDREFLRWAYPILKESCLFYLDNLLEEPTRKWLITGPSNSPENRFKLPDGKVAHVCLGPTIDMQLLRELFGNTARAAEILGVDAEWRSELLAKRARLAPNQIGPDGRLQEWLEPYPEPEPQHRHTSPMYGLHPYYEITLRGTPELAAACRKFLDARGDDSNGWALAWRMNLWARLGDGDRAHKLFKLLLRPAGGGSGSLPNLLGSCPPFQIEANFGGCAGVAECLLQSHEGRADFSPPESEVRKTDAPCEIELLPALPSAWPDGSVKGLKARGGFIVDINWQAGRVTTATIRSTQGGEARVRIGERLVPINLKPGESRILTNG